MTFLFEDGGFKVKARKKWEEKIRSEHFDQLISSV